MTDESPSGGALSEDSIGRRPHARADAIPALVSADLDCTHRYLKRVNSRWFDTPQDRIDARQMCESPALLECAFGMFTRTEDALERSQGGLGPGSRSSRGWWSCTAGSSRPRATGPAWEAGSPRLPTAPEPSDQEPDDRETGTATAAPPLRVLVADDSTDAREMLEVLLRLKGYDVRTAADGEQAVDVAKEHRPHAIVLDIGMPRVSGYEAAQRIRALPWASHAMLIAATGWGQAEDKARASACGFDHHLTKPVDIDALCGLLAGISTRTS